MGENGFTECALPDGELAKVSGGSSEEKYIIYTVVRGDTYATIAQRFGTTAEFIKMLNCVRDDEEPRCGQRLWVRAQVNP